jgi:plastocyanin
LVGRDLTRIAWAAGLALAVSAVVPAGAGAAAAITVEPTPGQNSFSPQQVTQPLGESTFTWTWGSGGAGTVSPHDVEQNALLFDSGQAKNMGSFEVTASAGAFPYFCSIHFGMQGRVSVTPSGGEAYPKPFRVAWASKATETGKRFDVRFKAGDGRWKIWREDTRTLSGVFGRNGEPARVKDGTHYSFQARSLRTTRKRSDWSPPLAVGG